MAKSIHNIECLYASLLIVWRDLNRSCYRTLARLLVIRVSLLFVALTAAMPASSDVVIVDQESNAISNNWWFLPLAKDKNLQLWAYTGKLSYTKGQNLDLYVNTNAEKYSVTIYRDGWQREVVYRQTGLEGKYVQTPEDCYEKGCKWPVSAYITLGSKWRTGGYVVHLKARDDEGRSIDQYAFFILKPTSQTNDIAFIVSSATWMAFNDWGGGNLYATMKGKPATQVSSRRPWVKGQIMLPDGAPWVALNQSLKTQPMNSIPRYPDIEWASAYGYSKYYARSGWATYDSKFAKWAEKNNYTMDYYTQQDLHANPALLNGYDMVVMVGHDAYWSAEMRANMDAFLSKGGKFARFAGGFMWQARISSDQSVLTSYRFSALSDDPNAKSTTDADKARTTTLWSSKLVNRPGATTAGGNGVQGLFANMGALSPRASGGFTIYRPDHWALRDTGLYYGDVLGDMSSVVGYAADGIDYTMVNGQPEPTGADGAPTSATIIGLAPTSIVEQNFGLPGELVPPEQADLRSITRIVYGSAAQANLAKLRYGAAVISVVPAGDGEIFCACSSGWVMGLQKRDKFIEQVTNNVLQRYVE